MIAFSSSHTGRGIKRVFWSKLDASPHEKRHKFLPSTAPLLRVWCKRMLYWRKSSQHFKKIWHLARRLKPLHGVVVLQLNKEASDFPQCGHVNLWLEVENAYHSCCTSLEDTPIDLLGILRLTSCTPSRTFPQNEVLLNPLFPRSSRHLHHT